MSELAWLIVGFALGAGAIHLISRYLRSRSNSANDTAVHVAPLIQNHFAPLATDAITISERKFPFRVRADLQRALDRMFDEETRVVHFCGVRKQFDHEGLKLTDCLMVSEHNATVSIPPEREQLDIGEEEPVGILKNGLWMLEQSGVPFVVLLAPALTLGSPTGMQFQIGIPNSAEGTRITRTFFKSLEDAVLRAESYRGKILSLEENVHSYTGESSGITVHRLRRVERDEVILPQATLTLLERNVVAFVGQRQRMAQYGLSTKKGILFYGPPGTGKTHTIHYLTRALEGHTTLLISAEQVGLLGEYMTLARLLQPSIVVLEDVDLIARDRADVDNPCSEVLLNKLLNEMDGLKEEADILFILTTNRPETLEAALASRPGRIDQAIEFPLPDADGRRKLVRLYARGVTVSDALLEELIRRTDGVSPAFIKELMRRAFQFQIERNGNGSLTHDDIDAALDEMLFRGGKLNARILGAGEASASATAVGGDE